MVTVIQYPQTLIIWLRFLRDTLMHLRRHLFVRLLDLFLLLECIMCPRDTPDAIWIPFAKRVKRISGFFENAGYFTTNNVKTDYNTIDAQRLIEESWDESSAKAHWRNQKRKKNQPFSLCLI